MEILTTFLWCGGAIIVTRLIVELADKCFQDYLTTTRLVQHNHRNAAMEVGREFVSELQATREAFLVVQKDIFPPISALLKATTARLEPEVQKTTDVPWPASLVTWIHTWPDQWVIDQQMKLAQEMYKDIGNWDQVGTAMIAEAKQTEIPDDDGLLQY